MSREPDAGGPGNLTPETLAELEELVRLRLGGRVREFRLSIRDAGLVLRGRATSHHAKQLAQQALLDWNRAPIRSNAIEVCDCRSPVPRVNDPQNGETR
jgi:hypothetical protein